MLWQLPVMPFRRNSHILFILCMAGCSTPVKTSAGHVNVPTPSPNAAPPNGVDPRSTCGSRPELRCMPRPGEWIVGRDVEKSRSTRFCKPIHFGHAQPNEEPYSIVACTSPDGLGSLGHLRADGTVTWSVAWPTELSAESVAPRGDGGWYVSRLVGDHDHAKVAEIVSLSQAGDIERVLQFGSVAWAQIAVLEPTPDGGVLAGGMFQISLDSDVDGKRQTLRSGYFGGFVAKIAPRLERVEWLTGIGGRDTTISDVMVLDDGGAAIIANGRGEITAGRLRATSAGSDRFWARLDARGIPTGLHVLAVAPRAKSSPPRVFFTGVGGESGLIDPSTGLLISSVQVPSSSPSTTEAIVLSRSTWTSQGHGTSTWLAVPKERAMDAPSYELMRIGSTGAVDRRMTVSAAPGSFFGSGPTFAVDGDDRLWMSGNVMSNAWDALPVAFAWWSKTPLTTAGTIALGDDRRIGAPPPSGCESKQGAADVYARLASWRSYEWMEPCGLAPWRFHDLPATLTFDADGRVKTASLSDPALTEAQRQCVVTALRERRVCVGVPTDVNSTIMVGP